MRKGGKLSVNELNVVLNTRKRDTMPGSDAIVYSLIRGLPFDIKFNLIRVFNEFLTGKEFPKE